MASDEILIGLERFLTEFFHPSTNNHRKHEIEEQLTRFGNQTGAWKHCLHILTHTRNEYVLMYCLSVLENLVNKMWVGCDPNCKAAIRTNLNQILLHHHKELPMFISHKLVKVIVDIGRVDWPMFYPTFFTSLLHLASAGTQDHGDTRALGLAALRIASEELAAPREDISAHRKEELKKLLLLQVPDILSVVTGSLKEEWSNSFKNFLHPSMSTPPPSPGSSHTNLFDIFSTPSEEMLSSSSSTSIEISQNSSSIMIQALECLCHLFSWIPLSTNISNDLLSTIFQYASLGTHSNLTTPGSTSLSTLGCHAMTCINELLTKNCIPSNFEDYLLRIFRQTFHILQQLTKTDNPRDTLERLDENYLGKFIEFLRLFVSSHFSRIESNSSFPLVHFFTLLFKFTFNQPSHEHYLNCLDIWEIFVDYVVTKVEQSKDHLQTKALLDRYKDGLIVYATAIIQHVQFRCNREHLEELDNSMSDDNGHTEWQNYLIENLEILAKICNLFPKEMMSVLYPILEETSTVYVETEWGMVSPSSGEQDIMRLHCSLKDLATVLQAFGRVSDLFLTEFFHERFDNALAVIEKFLNIALYGSRMNFYELSSRLPSTLCADVTEVHAEVLAALQPYTHWLSQLYSEAQHAGHSQAQLSQLLNAYVDAIVPVFSKQLPDKVALSAAHTLFSVATTIRATFLSQSTVIEKLFSDVTNGSCNKLQTRTQHLIFKALSNLLLFPWPNTPESEQKWEAREKGHSEFIKSLLVDFLSLTDNVARLQTDKDMKERAKPVIHRALLIVIDLVEAISEEVVKTRQLCYNSVKESITLSMELFPIYIDHPDTTEVVMSLFLSVFGALRRQMGVDLIARTIQSFISKFSHDQLEQTILHENVAGVRVVEKLLKILRMVIDDPGNAFKSFTPSIIVFAVQQIHPIVSQRPSPDVKGALFDLLHHLLLRRHRYFFPSPVLASMLTDGTMSGKGGTIAHKPQFLAIMSAYGNSFLQPDIAVFKQNLEALEDLNTKQKIYVKLHHILTQEGVLFQFVNVLIQALVLKSHDLLQDDVCTVVYNMSSVDFNFFHSHFIQQFLHNSHGVTQDQKNTLYQAFKQDTDLPSFTSNLRRFVNDLRYYRLCNSSLPEGTVNF
ncbi:exportin-6-like [Clavelina lepadiformis]|uniref:exportin-6-like n=1 Tax=Clavelina lepadiformis TaxID=159417 RepID=UPI0040422F1F